MAKENYIKLRCTKQFKEDTELLAERENRNTSNYIENLIKNEIEKMKNTGKENLKKANRMKEYDITLPYVEIGDIVTLSDIWDGEGEIPENSCSYLLAGRPQDGDYINYKFKFLEDGEHELDSEIHITDIELL